MTRLVELPLEVHWSHPLRAFDLDDDGDRAFVYETVLREGNTEHVRRFIDVTELARIWDRLFLPPNVEAAWADFFERIKGIRVTRRWPSHPSKPT